MSKENKQSSRSSLGQLLASLVGMGAVSDTIPKVETSDVKRLIGAVHYFTAEQGVLGAALASKLAGDRVGEHRVTLEVEIPRVLASVTICMLIMQNGFVVLGEAFCADTDEFDAEIGRKVAYRRAVRRALELESYVRQDMIAQQRRETKDPVGCPEL